MKRHEEIRIEGHVSAGFEAVQDAFAENFSRRHELGGACCVYYRGEKIVDLWGPDLVGNQGLGGDDARGRPLAWLARLSE